MKKAFFVALTFCFFTLLKAQEAIPYQPNITVKWAPTGLILGSLSFQGEYNFGGRSSLTAKIGVPVGVKHHFNYDGDEVGFTLKATSFLAGYRMYLSKKPLKGLYFEPYFNYVHHNSEGNANTTLDVRPVRMNFTNDYNGLGIGAQLGAQFFIGKRFVIDLFFLGPEINAASNNFKAVESSAALGWTYLEAKNAEDDIRNFINDIPFLRNHTDIMVDKNNRSVIADFKGALPGFRIGASFGISF